MVPPVTFLCDFRIEINVFLLYTALVVAAEPSLSGAVSAVIETYHLGFLLRSGSWCHIFKAADE